MHSTTQLNRAIRLAMATVLPLMAASTTLAGQNLLKDPGFETFKLNRAGYYELPDDSPWSEITMGRGSVQMNANHWKAPADMLVQQPLGFTPGTTGFEGLEPDKNSGRIIMQQDVVAPELLSKAGQYYEAWVWLGGGGKDTDKTTDNMEEEGGWEIFFYGDTNTANWKEGSALEYHKCVRNFWGAPGTFVQLSGFGKLPAHAKGFRIRCSAGTWSTAKGPANYPTEVGLDNAYFGILEPNLLINGDFELDDQEGEFKGWQRPSALPFGRENLKPLDLNSTYGENFDHGTYRPFYGGRFAYGYSTYLRGWGRHAFSFSQVADYDLPSGTPLTLMFNWIQNVAEPPKSRQMRTRGTQVQIIAEFLKDGRRIGAEGFIVDWPVPQANTNACRYDQNANLFYNPRFRLEPPAGTEKVGVYVNFIVNMIHEDGASHVNAAIDDFYLGAAPR